MKIVGLQKMTLLDYPGKVACTVFLEGCNFRCPFCHNSQLLGSTAQPVMTQDGLLDFLKKRRGLLDGVCITGGEPTLSPGLEGLLARIKALGFSVKLDTNGSRPEVLKALVERGLVDYVAMDIKNSPERYALTCGNPALEIGQIGQSVRFLMSGQTDYELRTTVAEPFHDEASIAAMGRWLSGFGRAKQHFLQPFVDRETVAVSGLSSPNREKLLAFRDILLPFVEKAEIRGID